MNKCTVNLTLEFENELNALLFTNHSITSAKQFFFTVRKCILSLETFPERYSRISNCRKYLKQNIRRIIIKNYVIIYSVDNEAHQIFILHIFHGNQDYLDKL